jgi:hypothetical protein
MIIDCDVHPLAHEGLAAIFPHISQSWRKRLQPLKAIDGVENASAWASGVCSWRAAPTPGGCARTPSRLTGGAAASDLEFLHSHHLDRHGIDIAVLLPIQSAKVDAFTSPKRRP